MSRDILRRCRFAPYLKGKGPRFSLTIWDTGRYDNRGSTYIGYRLSMYDPVTTEGSILFEGEDFAGSPVAADDSDDTIRGLMSFLTLRPGDTDREYFANYTPAQLDYCAQHAEALGFEVTCRYGED